MPPDDLRLPAEWEPQAAILLAWPHARTDWAARLGAAEATCARLIAEITRFERALVCVPDAPVRAHAAALLRGAGADLDRVRCVEVAYDDTWLRDTGPITLQSGAGLPQIESGTGAATARVPQARHLLVDFRFTGWGGKFEAARDDALIGALLARGVFAPGVAHRRVDWALEGGAIESDGLGTILTTWRCLHQRHPGQPRPAIAATLRDTLSATRVLWLDHGHLEGDDTDAHIDTLARFAPNNAIVYQACSDPDDAHYAKFAAMRREIEALCTPAGSPYRTFPLPWPKPIADEGRRLAASYANYLVVNGAVLVPAYGDAVDAAAAATIGGAHPGRTVVQIPCRPLLWQNGSLHCVTMQLPAGVMAL